LFLYVLQYTITQPEPIQKVLSSGDWVLVASGKYSSSLQLYTDSLNTVSEKYECNCHYIINQDKEKRVYEPLVSMIDKAHIIYFISEDIVYNWNLNEENSKPTVLTKFE